MASGVVRRIQGSLVSGVGGALVTGIMRSTRATLIHGEVTDQRFVRRGVPAIYVLWHGRLLPCAWYYRNLGLGTLISRNRDGNLVTGMIERWGYRVIRGSSSRGAVGAQLAIVRALRAGTSVALTPDGPRGPRQKMKLGPIRVASKTGVPLIPVSAGARSARVFGRWDRFVVPRPFTWLPVALGEPVWVHETASEDEMTEAALALERELDRLTALVDDAARTRKA